MKSERQYKASESIWIPKIPENWKIEKLKQYFFLQKGLVITKQDLQPQGIPIISYGQIHSKQNTALGNNGKLYRFVDEKFAKESALLSHGDFVFADTSEDRKGCGNCAYIDTSDEQYAGYHTLILKNKNLLIDSKYLAYQFLSEPWRFQIRSRVEGVKLYTISKILLGQCQILVPPQREQEQIVKYLDWKTSAINRLINGYQKQISLLREYRQTLIDNAVMHGIEKAHLKQSGVSWIKEIPEHWNMVYAKKLFAQRKEKAYPEDEQLTASQKYGVISQNKFMELEGRRLTVVITGEDILKHVGKGDFVLSMRSFQGGLEYSEEEGKISSAYVMLIPNTDKVYAPFFKWLLKSKHYIKALQGTSDLVRDGQALRYANFAKVPLPEIPISEQIQIANYINSKTQVIDNLISKTKHKIELIKEYKATLISNVVIGQVDVRDVQIPEYATVELNDVLDDSDGKIEG